MLKTITIAAVAAFTFAVAAAPAQARDGRNGAAAAGIIGGIAAGAIIGSQINRNDGYRDNRYRARARYRECRIERHDYEDRYGRLHVRRVKVCD